MIVNIWFVNNIVVVNQVYGVTNMRMEIVTIAPFAGETLEKASGNLGNLTGNIVNIIFHVICSIFFIVKRHLNCAL